MPKLGQRVPFKAQRRQVNLLRSKAPLAVRLGSRLFFTVSTSPPTIRSFWMTSSICRLCFSPRSIASSRLSGNAPGTGLCTTTPPGSVTVFGTGA